MYHTRAYRVAVASLAIPLAAAAVSFAQTADPANPGVRTNEGVQTSGMQQMNHDTVLAVRASKLIGMNVYGEQDKSLGEIKDAILDQGGQRIGYVVMAHGTVLGMGGKLVAIPYRTISVASTGSRETKAHVSLSEQALRDAPAFDKDHWPDKTDATAYYKQTDEYFSKLEARPAGARMDTSVNADMAPQGAIWDRRLSSYMDTKVESPDGTNLGEIKDVVIDWNSGKVQYTVLSFGGILGVGDKLFAIPIDQFKTQPDSKKFVLAIDKDRLKNAPGFDKNNWPDFADTTWRRTNDQFYTTPQ